MGGTYQAHWPRPHLVNPPYLANANGVFWQAGQSNAQPTAHQNVDEVYHLFDDSITSGTVNIGFAFRPGTAVSQLGSGRSFGIYWGDSSQPFPSSSVETGRLFLQLLGLGSFEPSANARSPMLQRSTGPSWLSDFTTLATGPSASFELTTLGATPPPITGTKRYWYWLELEIYPAPTGSLKLYINNSPTPAIDYVGDTRGVGNSEVVDFLGFRLNNLAGPSGTPMLDDIVTFHNKKAVEQYCVVLRPDSENFTGSFTTGSEAGVAVAANCFSSINDNLITIGTPSQVEATGTFMYTTTGPDSGSFNYDNLPFVPPSIQGVQAHNLINMDGVTFTSIQNNLITGSVGLVTGSDLVQPNPGSWEMVSEIYSWHPTSSVNTSEDFSSADLNAIIDELKVK